jgi:hypothetical protein
MRSIRARSQISVSFLCHAGAWVALASIAALCLATSLHGSVASGPAPLHLAATVDAGLDVDAPAAAASHDPDLCPVCHVIRKARAGLRAPARALALADLGSRLPQQLPEAAQPLPPSLRSAAPRAPPVLSAPIDA